MNQVSNIAYTGKGSAVSKSYISTRKSKKLAELEEKKKKSENNKKSSLKEVKQTLKTEKENLDDNKTKLNEVKGNDLNIKTKEVSKSVSEGAVDPKNQEISVCTLPEVEEELPVEPEIIESTQSEQEITVCPIPEPEVEEELPVEPEIIESTQSETEPMIDHKVLEDPENGNQT